MTEKRKLRLPDPEKSHRNILSRITDYVDNSVTSESTVTSSDPSESAQKSSDLAVDKLIGIIKRKYAPGECDDVSSSGDESSTTENSFDNEADSDQLSETSSSVSEQSGWKEDAGDAGSESDSTSNASHDSEGDVRSGDEDVSGGDVTDNSNHEVPEADDSIDLFHEDLRSVSFEDILKLRDKIGIKQYNSSVKMGRQMNSKNAYKRENKNRPMEMSSKRPVGVKGNITKKKVTRDPRFDDLSGEFSEQHFKKSFDFLNDIEIREKQELVKTARKEKDSEKKHRLLGLVNKLDQRSKASRLKEAREERDKSLRKEELSNIRQGKKAYFLKESEKKKLDLAEKFKELKKSGKLESYVSKKRKRNAAKDRKTLPAKHFKQS